MAKDPPTAAGDLIGGYAKKGGISWTRAVVAHRAEVVCRVRGGAKPLRPDFLPQKKGENTG